MPARFSKRDFWNLGKFWDRNRWTKIFLLNKFRRKNPKTFWSNFFWDQHFSIFDRFFFRWESQWKFKISKFRKIFEKNQNFEILNFHWFFQRKNFRQKIEIFWSQKKNSTKSFRIFVRRKIFRQFFSGLPISIPNDPKIPKITLRTACDHYKITNSEHEEKVSDFPPILTSWGVPISWILCVTLVICWLPPNISVSLPPSAVGRVCRLTLD